VYKKEEYWQTLSCKVSSIPLFEVDNQCNGLSIFFADFRLGANDGADPSSSLTDGSLRPTGVARAVVPPP